MRKLFALFLVAIQSFTFMPVAQSLGSLDVCTTQIESVADYFAVELGAKKLKLKKIQDFEDKDVDSWTNNTAASISIGEQDGNHYAAAVNYSSGNRGAYYDNATEAIKATIGEETAWVIEWDLAMQSGNVKERSQAMFGVGTSTSTYTRNSPNITNMLFAIEDDANPSSAINKVWHIVKPAATGTASIVPEENKLATVNLEPDVFYHYQLSFDNGKVTATITNDTLVAKVSYETTYTLADFRGFVTAVGRGSGYSYLDNIAAGVYTDEDFVEDPTFQVFGVTYDSVTVKLTTETKDAIIKYTLNDGEALTYADSIILDSTAVVAAWAEREGELSNKVRMRIVACYLPVPKLNKEGVTCGANTVTITNEIDAGTIHYTINDGEVMNYSGPFVTDSTIKVKAWIGYETRCSASDSLIVVAGEIATPTLKLYKVDGIDRQIYVETTTTQANIVYTIDDNAEIVAETNQETITIEQDTRIKVWARYTEGEKVFESSAIDTFFTAGTEIQLMSIEIAEVYSGFQTTDVRVSSNQMSVLLNPNVDIYWSYQKGEERRNGIAANGEIIKDVPIGAIFQAYAKSDGYIDSKTISVEIVPFEYTSFFNEDYEDGTTGSWTMQIAGMLANTAAADGSHYLHFFQQGQSGGRWAQLVFPEYISTDYILSFKWGVAAGNNAENVFTVYAGEEELFRFVTPIDMDWNAGERITTVYAADGSKIGEFSFYLNSRFEFAEDKPLADVEVSVNESGVELTVINNLGQTQVKAKIADEPVIITRLYELLGRIYGSWRIDDIKIINKHILYEPLVLVEDAKKYLSSHDTNTELVEYSRTFSSADKWQALYVPFSIPVDVLTENGLEVVELNNIHMYDTDGDKQFDKTTLEFLYLTDGETEANYPYLIKSANAGEVKLMLKDVELKAAAETQIECASTRKVFKIKGTYTGVSGADMFYNNYYAVGGGTLVRAASADNALKPQRWYMSIENKDGSPVDYFAPKMRIMINGMEIDEYEENETGIQEISAKHEPEGTIYTLDGRKLIGTDALKSGIYVKNHQKMIVR